MGRVITKYILLCATSFYDLEREIIKHVEYKLNWQPYGPFQFVPASFNEQAAYVQPMVKYETFSSICERYTILRKSMTSLREEAAKQNITWSDEAKEFFKTFDEW